MSICSGGWWYRPRQWCGLRRILSQWDLTQRWHSLRPVYGCCGTTGRRRWRIARMGLALGLIVLFSFVVLEHILDVSSASTGSSSIVRSKTKSAPRPRCSQQQLAFPNGPRLLAGEPKSSHPGPAKCGSLPGAMRLLIGRSGLLGYVLQLEWLYQSYRFNSMALARWDRKAKQPQSVHQSKRHGKLRQKVATKQTITRLYMTVYPLTAC